MSEFEFSTLGMLAFLLAALGGYSYWQVYRAKRAQRKRASEFEPHLGLLTHDESEAASIEPDLSVEASSARPRWSQTTQSSSWHGAVTPVSVHAPSSTPVYVESAPQGDRNITFYVEENVSESDTAHLMIEASSDVVAMKTQLDNASESVLTVHEQIEQGEAIESLEHLDSVQSTSLIADSEVEDVQFFSQQDESEHAALTVFDPLMRFATWIDAAQPAPIQSIDGVLDITLSQPKLMADIERALYDLHLDTDLPLRLLGRRAGHDVGTWHSLEAGALYSGLRLTLQLANKSVHVDAKLIQAWFVLAQKFVKRLAATVQAWPDPAALASYAVYLHDLAQHLAAPIIVQLHKPTGLWPAYEVHQHMTQWGIALSDQGQYLARADDGKVLYSVLNDINNPHAQDFYKDALPSMHANTLSFCLDLARIDVAYQPSLRLWHDMHQISQNLQAQWCNVQGVILDVPALMNHADVQINAYYQQLSYLNIPAGSLMLRRLVSG